MNQLGRDPLFEKLDPCLIRIRLSQHRRKCSAVELLPHSRFRALQQFWPQLANVGGDQPNTGEYRAERQYGVGLYFDVLLPLPSVGVQILCQRPSG